MVASSCSSSSIPQNFGNCQPLNCSPRSIREATVGAAASDHRAALLMLYRPFLYTVNLNL